MVPVHHVYPALQLSSGCSVLDDLLNSIPTSWEHSLAGKCLKQMVGMKHPGSWAVPHLLAPHGSILGCPSHSPQQLFWGVLPRAWQQQMVRAVWTPSLPFAMFTCLNLTPQPASSILSRPVLLWLSCGSGSCCSVSWLPRTGGLLLAPSLRQRLALPRSWASQFSLLVGFIFKPGCAALRTAGSLVLSSLVSLSIYSTVGFRKSPLIPLQPTDVFLLAVVAPKQRPGILGSSLGTSKGMVPLSVPLGTPVVGSVGASQ